MSDETQDGNARADAEGSCSPCCSEGCRREFRCSNFGLQYEIPDLFVYNQWTQRPSVAFLIYRLVVTLYFTAIAIYSMAVYDFTPKWLWAVYLTRWTFVLLVCAEILKTSSAIVGYVQGRNKPKDEPVYNRVTLLMRISWVFNNASVTSAFVITILYWVVVYSGWELDIRNLTTHAFNSVYIVIDLCITGMPTRFHHWPHPVIYGATWQVFSVIYWAAGGKGERGVPYIYPVLDYGKSPGTAVAWLLAVLVFGFVIHTIHFGLFKLRQFVYQKCSKRNEGVADVIEMT